MWVWLWRKGESGYSGNSTAEQVTQGIDGHALTAIVTGATSGIGAETARVLALRGVHVVMGVRNLSAGKDVKEAISRDFASAEVDAMELDLSSMASVRKFASEFKSSGLPLNLLINNAGVMATPFTLSKDNIELQFATNHLGHFLLTNLLLDTMRTTASESGKEGRIVNVSSRRHKLSYPEGIRFDKINDPSWKIRVNITANSVHPGAVATDFFCYHTLINGLVHFLGRYIIKNVKQGAATICYVALHPEVKGISGKYFADCNLAKSSSQANDAILATKVWDFSSSLVK